MHESNFNERRSGGPVLATADDPTHAVAGRAEQLYEQPKSGQTWTHVLLASRTGLPPEDGRATFASRSP